MNKISIEHLCSLMASGVMVIERRDGALNEIPFSRRFMAGRKVFEVPVIRKGNMYKPRAPRGGWSAFYTADNKKCFVVCSKTAATYLERRKYARLIGVATYSSTGLGRGPDRRVTYKEAASVLNGTSTLTELAIDPEAHTLRARGAVFDVTGWDGKDYLLQRREAINASD